jgi:hypothetical protein
MTPEEIENISEEIRQDNASKIKGSLCQSHGLTMPEGKAFKGTLCDRKDLHPDWDGHATAFGHHDADCECGLHPYPGRKEVVAAKAGPTGSETTPPFGVLKHAAERKADGHVEEPKERHTKVVKESKEMRKYRLDTHAAVHAELLERDLREELGDEVYEQLYSED